MSCCKAIGGYLELELRNGPVLYPRGYPLNSGRAGLEIIVRHRAYKRVWVPAYICNAVYVTLEKLNVEALQYEITPDLEPKEVPSLSSEEGFLYVNYFGIKDNACKRLSSQRTNVILDLTQALFYEPEPNIDGFNSLRKFVGVPDGGYLFGNCSSGLHLPRTSSWHHCEHLLRRADEDVNGGYDSFKASEAVIDSLSPMQMSRLTERIVKSIHFDVIRERRSSNYQYLHRVLSYTNELNATTCNGVAPLCYPYLVRNGCSVREKIMERRIYLPTYWPDIGKRIRDLDTEKDLMMNLLCLPIDQRCGKKEMDLVLEVLRQEGAL